jgi:hypothetical protein
VVQVRFGSRLCENAKTLDRDRRSHLCSAALDAHTICRVSFEIDFQNFILLALRAFVFSHSLGQKETWRALQRIAYCS